MNFSDIGIDTASLAGSLESKLAASRAAGFAQVMISAADIAGHAGGAATGIRAVRESGLAVTGLEALRDFEGLEGQLHAYKLDVAKSMLEICGAIGARLLLVEASTSAHADAGIDSIVRDLRKLSLLAVPLGIRIAFKGLSWSRTVKNFAAAGDIVVRANCPNLGIAIDAFDIIAAGVPPEDAEGIDPDQIFLVQLSDFMGQEIRTTEEQATAARHFRVFPGEGAHSEALANLVTRLDAIGYYGDYSFDVYNDDYLQMPPETVSERARRAADWLGETVLRRALPVPNMERLRRATGPEG
jgi:sugar phosphate isomerase/epimerase